MEFSKYLSQFRDPYERKARLWPGLLVIAPIIIALASRFGAKHPLLTTVSTVLGSCGGVYALINVVRGRGKYIEEKLISKWGGMPTTIALRHRDKFIDNVSKQRYHDLIVRKLGIQMPTAEEELSNPEKADDTYVGATKRLRELTRGNKGLLFKENIAYGFHRNMLGMKMVGIIACVLAIALGAGPLRVFRFQPPYIIAPDLTQIDLPSGLTIFAALVFLATWLFYFRPAAVRRVGFVYAERLFECLSSVKSSRQPRSEVLK